MLDYNELLELEETLKAALDENLEHILFQLNRTDRLEELFILLGLEELLGIETQYIPKDGKIIVIGQSEVKKDVFAAIAKDCGFEKDRFEFYLDYEDAKTFDFKKTQWSSKYSYIMAGPVPHSGKAKGDYSGIITALENQEGYPPVIRLGIEKLRITKTSFREGLMLIKQKENVA